MRVRTKLLGLLFCVAALFASTSEARAENLIQRPGAHNQYSVELEPHLYVRYARWAKGIGPGFRASIPFMHNGPIKTLNNNIGISFGVDLPFVRRYAQVDIPVAFQWNFYFTDIFSALGEVGLNTSIWTGPGNTFAVDPLFLVGGRAQFGVVGIIARAGWPGFSLGANFQF